MFRLKKEWEQFLMKAKGKGIIKCAHWRKKYLHITFVCSPRKIKRGHIETHSYYLAFSCNSKIPGKG